jgi:hypothetical protein
MAASFADGRGLPQRILLCDGNRRAPAAEVSEGLSFARIFLYAFTCFPSRLR